MLTLAFALLCGAAALGAALAIRYLAGRTQPAAVAAMHGLLGAAGLACLLPALRGLPESRFGTGGFGPAAAALLGLALALGLAMAAMGRRRRPAGALIGTHAGLAIAGVVMVLAVLSLR